MMSYRANSEEARRVLALLLLMAVPLGAMYALGLRVNASDSHVPIGFYRETEGRDFSVGDIVVFRVGDLYALYPERENTRVALHPSGSLIKKIAALPGALVERSGDTLLIDGRHFARAVIRPPYEDGTDPCKVSYPHVVEDGCVWLMADTEQSFDSRYFGDVPVSVIQTKAERFWVW